MKQIGVRLQVNPDIIKKLGSENNILWSAAHNDGSDNRFDENDVLESASYGVFSGILAAAFQGIKKAFGNRGKTKDDLAAEKEAANINKAFASFNLMLRDYLQAAQEGGIEEDDLGDLIDMLKEVEGYAQAGKLKIPGTKELTEIRKSIAAYTAALMKAQEKSPDERTGIPAAEEFRLIREQLTRQKDWLK